MTGIDSTFFFSLTASKKQSTDLMIIPLIFSGFSMVFSSVIEQLAQQYLLSLGQLDTSEIMEFQL